MRVMLGRNGEPWLLVKVDSTSDMNEFDFWVINGAWHGVFTFGTITVLGGSEGDFVMDEKLEILLSDSPRLRGDYQDVFDNGDNVEYNGPEEKSIKELFPDLDDDIPF